MYMYNHPTCLCCWRAINTFLLKWKLPEIIGNNSQIIFVQDKKCWKRGVGTMVIACFIRQLPDASQLAPKVWYILSPNNPVSVQSSIEPSCLRKHAVIFDIIGFLSDPLCFSIQYEFLASSQLAQHCIGTWKQGNDQLSSV